jgi:histidine triad (HIT) family protein
MSSVFTKIIEREIPAHVVYEDDQCLVILDKYPSIKGQTLVIPKDEVDYAFDLPAPLYQHLLTIARKIAHASDKAFATERTCLVVEGFEIPHAHIKLYPMTPGNADLAGALTRGEEASDEDLEVIATQLIAAIEDDE